MVTATGDRTRRRGKRQQESETTPSETTSVDVGAIFRAARAEAGVTLAEIHDRTGIPWLQLEALEAGELARIPDRRSVLAAVRRYADLLDLDAIELSRDADKQWSAAVGVAPAPTSPNSTATRGATTPLGPYMGDGPHLRAFTQTGQIPGLGGNGGNGFGGRDMTRTGIFRAVPARGGYVRPAPLALRMAVWMTAVLVVVGLIGLAVGHYQRQWLADVHIIRATTPNTQPSTVTSPGPSARPPSGVGSQSSTVTMSNTGPGAASVSVRASEFSIVVSASQPCWVSASTPQSFQPIFQGVLQSGQTTTLASANGQLTVMLGASNVALAAKVNNRLVPGWLFKPSSAPFTLNFSSVTS